MAYIELISDILAPVSPAGRSRIRYNVSLNQFEQSLNGGAYITLGGGGGGGGDMFKATYDPTNISGDAFDMANMVENAGGAGALILTTAERVLIGSGLQNVVEDLSPQYGANMDNKGFDLTGAGGIGIAGLISTSAGNVTAAAGNVGAGTASPTHRLHAESAGSLLGKFETTGAGTADVDIVSTGGTAKISLANAGKLTISGPSLANALVVDGTNVGIDQGTPLEKLHVGGAILIGTTAGAVDGTIRWTGTDFEGRKGGAWVTLTAAGGGGGETNLAANVGTSPSFPGSAQVFRDKIGVTLNFKAIRTGTAVAPVAPVLGNLQITNDANDVTLTVPAASVLAPGAAEIATQAEVDAGTDSNRFVTPSTLANTSLLCNVQRLVSSDMVIMYSGTLAAGNVSKAVGLATVIVPAGTQIISIKVIGDPGDLSGGAFSVRVTSDDSSFNTTEANAQYPNVRFLDRAVLSGADLDTAPYDYRPIGGGQPTFQVTGLNALGTAPADSLDVKCASIPSNPWAIILNF